MSTAIIRYDGTLHTRAGAWVSLPLDERRRQAITAAQTKDAEALWSLLEAFLATYSDAGATISRHTLRAYRRSLQVFVADAAAQGMNLIRPARDTGARWVRALEAHGLAPATVQIRLAAVRMLYRALRWAVRPRLTHSPMCDQHVTRPCHGKAQPLPACRRRAV